jgi:hypothetical protein
MMEEVAVRAKVIHDRAERGVGEQVILVESPNFLQRRHHSARGLTWIDVGASEGAEMAERRSFGAS